MPADRRATFHDEGGPRMTRPRLFLPATALTASVAVALALAGCGGSEEASPPPEPPAAPATEPATTESQTQPATTETEPATTETATEPTTTETEPATTEGETEPTETEAEDEPDVDVFIQVADGERVGGKGRVEAKKGDHVRIEISVDAAQEFHLHGYDLSKRATPRRPAVFEFEAELEGIFALESHESEEVIVDVVVEP
jgi:hypothetical protein